jgi:WD40 repeat protein
VYTIKLFKEEIDDWTCYCTMESHDSTVWKVCFDGTGSRLVSCSDDKTLKIWQEYLPGNSEGVVTSGNNPTWKCVCTLSGFLIFV